MKKRLFSLLLVLAMVVGMLPTVAMATNDDINVTVTLQQKGEFLQMPTEMAISADLSTTYGYTDEGTEPTVLDALIAVHKVYLTEEVFTPEDANLYLAVNDGYITTVLCEETVNFGFAVNHAMPTDGNPQGPFNECTALTCTEATLQEGDTVDFFFYLDGQYDQWVNFDAESYTAEANESFNVTLKGYRYAANGAYENIEESTSWTSSIIGADIASVDAAGTITDLNITTDDDGTASVTFTEPGTYYLTASHDSMKLIRRLIPVTVTEAPATADTFTIPDGAELYVGKFGAEYAPYEDLVATETATADGVTTVTYDIPMGSAEYVYIVSQDGEMQYANTFKKTDDNLIEKDLTEVFENEYDEDSIIRDIDNHDSNIFLNINETHQKDMATGDTFQILPYRITQAYLNTFSYPFLRPEFHYDVTVLDGTSPVTVDENGLLTANAEGTAIVTVTYDSLQAYDKMYGAIYPENTGAFVVRVGDDLGTVATGIELDAELDVVYYEGESTEYTFTPATGSTVSYLNPTIGAKSATYGTDFTDATMEEGSATVILTEGRNIIKVVNGNDTTYQLVTAKPVTITVMGEDDVAISDTNKAALGETLTITVDGLTEPAPKMSRIYNFNSGVRYTGSDDEKYGKGAKSQGFGNYTFLTTGGVFTFVVPDDWSGESFDFTQGDIGVYAYGGQPGAHRTVTTKGLAVSMSTQVADYFGTLPDISIPVDVEVVDPEYIGVTVSVFDGTKFLTKDDSIVTEVQTYAGQALDKGFEDMKLNTDGDYDIDDDDTAYAFATAKAAGEVTYFDAMLAWQIANNNLQDANIEALKEKTDYEQSNYGGVFVTKFNGEATSDLNYMQNGEKLETGVATQYVSADDHLTVSFWKDADYSNNITPNYIKDSETITTLTCGEDTDTAVTMEYSYYGAAPDYALETAKVANAQLATVDLQTGVLTALDGVTTDENGVATLNFAETGTYTVAPISGEGQDIYPTFLTVTVTEATGGSTGGGSTGGDSTSDEDTVTVKIYGVESSVEEGTAIYDTNKSAFTIWANETVEIASGDKAWDAIKAVLDQEELDYDYSAGYISSVKGLAEMGRGSNSGWKYTLNGEYPNVAVDVQAIADGDVIVVHYTDDYTKEADADDQTSGGGSTGGATGGSTTVPKEEVTEEEEATTVTVENFTDIKTDDWYYDATAFVVEKGLFEGTSKTTFAPNNTMTRAMIMTVLHRYSGDETVAQGENWQDAGMTWSKENGISDGTNPNANVTREQLVTMLYRYAKAEKAEADMSVFTDADQVSSWAVDAMTWAIANGMIQGTSTTTLDPTGNATRAQVAAIMMRFAALMEQ